MVVTHNIEKKIPCTVLEEIIANKSFQFAVESSATFEECFQALDAFKAHVEELKRQSDEKAKQEAENPAQG